jgi:2-nitropropane dioxygenase.
MPAAMLSIDQLREELKTIRQHTQRPINVNYFCHQPPAADEQRARDWKNLLEPYYRELGVDFDAPTPVSNRAPFDNAACEVIEEVSPRSREFPLRPAGKAPAGSRESHWRESALLGHHGRRGHLARAARL